MEVRRKKGLQILTRDDSASNLKKSLDSHISEVGPELKCLKAIQWLAERGFVNEMEATNLLTKITEDQDVKTIKTLTEQIINPMTLDENKIRTAINFLLKEIGTEIEEKNDKIRIVKSIANVINNAPTSPYHGMSTNRSPVSFSDIAHREEKEDKWWIAHVVNKNKGDDKTSEVEKKEERERKHSIDSASTTSLDGFEDEEGKFNDSVFSSLLKSNGNDSDQVFIKSINVFRLLEKWRSSNFRLRDGVLGIWYDSSETLHQNRPKKTILFHAFMRLGPIKNKFDKKTNKNIYYRTLYEHPNADYLLNFNNNPKLSKPNTLSTYLFQIMENQETFTRRVLKFGSIEETCNMWSKSIQAVIDSKQREFKVKVNSTTSSKCEFLYCPVIPKHIFLSPRSIDGSKNISGGKSKDLGDMVEYVIHFLNGVSETITISKYGTAGDACKCLKDRLGLVNDGLYSIFVKGNYSAPTPLQDDEILKPHIQKSVIFVYRQELFIPDSDCDKEVQDATICENAAHRLALADCVHKVLQGFYRINFETCIFLAALLIRADLGPYNPLAHQRGSFRHFFHKILPRYHYEDKKIVVVEDAIIKAHSEFDGEMTKLQAEKKYLRMCMELPTFGSSWFHGTIMYNVYQNESSFPPTAQMENLSQVIIGINFTGISVMSEKVRSEKESNNHREVYNEAKNEEESNHEMYLYEDIYKWANLGDLNAFSFLYKVGKDEKSQEIITFFTPDFKKMEYVVDSYVMYKIKMREEEELCLKSPSKRI